MKLQHIHGYYSFKSRIVKTINENTNLRILFKITDEIKDVIGERAYDLDVDRYLEHLNGE